MTNFPDSLQTSYQRYLVRSIKKALSLEGIFIRLRFVPRT
ncbi:MAG: hypothetical protein WAR22_13185 [Desulfomonilia bacterium]